MIFFLLMMVLLSVAWELYSLFDGLSHINFPYQPKTLRSEPGEPFPVEIRVSNTGVLPITYLHVQIPLPINVHLPRHALLEYLQGEETLDEKFSLWGKKDIVRKGEWSVQRRGLYQCQPATLRRGDFLGIREAFETIPCREQFLVFPAPLLGEDLEYALGRFLGDYSARRFLLRDPVLTIGCREYTGQEPMHTISWLQTAKRGELMVREFDDTRDISCAVLLTVTGLGLEEYDLIDCMASLGRGVCEFLAKKGIRIRLFTDAVVRGYSTKTVFTVDGTAERMDDILEPLARVGTAPACGLGELKEAARKSEGGSAACVWIAPHENGYVASAVRELEIETGLNANLIFADRWSNGNHI